MAKQDVFLDLPKRHFHAILHWDCFYDNDGDGGDELLERKVSRKQHVQALHKAIDRSTSGLTLAIS